MATKQGDVVGRQPVRLSLAATLALADRVPTVVRIRDRA
jgi:hypothetical protein